MATVIYIKNKDGVTEKSMCDARLLLGKLAQGYVVDPSELEEKESEKGSAVNADADPWAGYSNADIRELAKEAGIENHEKARIEPLKEALEKLG